MNMRATTSPTGFTVVELVVVLLLLGILSAVALPRMVAGDAFAAVILSQHLREELAYARQLASSRQDTVVRFRLTATAPGWSFETLSLADGGLREWAVAENDLSVRIRNGAGTVQLVSSAALELIFNGRGHLAAATAGTAVFAPDLGLELQIEGGTPQQLCIYPSGATAEGACD